MKEDYNRRVNDYLQKNGAIDTPRADWQKKLDTDFMADPRYVSEADFRDVAKMNNDAYMRRHAAEFEKISRQEGGGKISPQHVTEYTEEMSDFARKKQSKISEMFKNPSQFGDPANRAKVIQMMAQEEKYISRMEALDAYLRKQEGLAPRNLGKTTAAKGAVRSPENVIAIKDAHAVAEASRAKAIEDLAETMGEVAKRNPEFAKSAADDIVKIISQAPAEHQAEALAALRRTNPELASAVHGHPGLGSLDEIAHAGDDVRDLTRAGEELTEAAKVSKMRKGLNAAAEAMEKLGKIAAAADVTLAAAQIKDYVNTIQKALDPNTSDAEAADLFKRAEEMAHDLAESSALIAIMERHPAVAGIFGTWTLACVSGEWIAANRETGHFVGRSKGTCLDRQMTAWDKAVDWWKGKTAAEAAQKEERCQDLVQAVRDGRVTIKGDYKVVDLCSFIRHDVPISDVIHVAGADGAKPEKGQPEEKSSEEKPEETTAGCKTSGVEGDSERLAADEQSCQTEPEKDTASKEPAECAALAAQFDVARKYFARKQGLTDTKNELDSIQSKLDAMEPDACPSVRERVNKGVRQVTKMRDGLRRVKQDLANCEPEQLRRRAEQLSQKQHVWLKSLGERAALSVAVAEYYQKANAAYLAGDMQGAQQFYKEALLRAESAGRPTCVNIVERINKNLTKIAGVKQQEDWINKVASSCELPLIQAERVKLASIAKVSFQYAMVDRLDAAIDTCKAQEQEAVEAREKQTAGNRQAVCTRDFGAGYVVGHVLEDGRFFCTPTQATADAWCVNKYGAGTSAANIDTRGGFVCNTGKEAADAWCQKNNTGSGWYAGEIRADGSYDCHLSEEGQRAVAEADCRNQHGNRLIRVYKRKGQYWCEYQRTTRNARRRNPNRRRRRQPGYNPDAAAAAAVAGAVIQGIQTLQRNKQAQRRCHRNPYTGQLIAAPTSRAKAQPLEFDATCRQVLYA